MNKILVLIGALIPLAASARQAPPATYYQIDLAPTGKMISIDAPMIKGSTYLFHGYPSGALQSLRKADVVRVTKISPQVATQPADTLVQIGNLAMQGGGGAQAGPKSLSSVAPKNTGPELGKGFYGNLVPGMTEGMPNSANDYQVGRTFAAPPATGVQSSPGAPPTMPSATSGSNPPQ